MTDIIQISSSNYQEKNNGKGLNNTLLQHPTKFSLVIYTDVPGWMWLEAGKSWAKEHNIVCR